MVLRNNFSSPLPCDIKPCCYKSTKKSSETIKNMKNNHINFSSEPEFTKYYGLSDFPEAMFLIEAECFASPADTTTNTESSTKGIIFGLGMVVTLIVLSVLQLYRSIELTPANPEITKSRKLSTSNREARVIHERKFKSRSNYQRMSGSTDKIESFMLKNAIAHGRF